jgi:alpha-1,3-rhamnosyltransferase
VIPLYNHEDYILDTLKSVTTQDYPNLEVVLIDDASKDNGLKLAKKKLSLIGADYKILENKFNKGVCATVNRAVSNANGKYTCLIASDDLLAKGRIKKHVQILEKLIDPSVIACYGPVQVFDETNSNLSTIDTFKGDSNHTFTSVLTKKSKIPLQGCTFNTKILKKLPFDENLYFEDWDFFIRLFLDNYKIINDKNISAYYRKHAKGTNLNIVKMIESRNKIKDKYFKIIAAKDKKLANSFSFTVEYWNFIGMSYLGNKIDWFFVLMKLFISNPLNMIKKLKDTCWAFKNLLKAK